MGFKDKITSITNKATDVMVNAKATYEKNCVKIDCVSLKDIRDIKTVKGIVDFDKQTVEFSGVIETECLEIKKPIFFITQDARCFELVDSTTKTETIEIALKSKTENFVITKSKIIEKRVTLSNI